MIDLSTAIPPHEASSAHSEVQEQREIRRTLQAPFAH